MHVGCATRVGALWMNRADGPPDPSASAMTNLRLDAAAVRAAADGVLDSAARLDEIHWPTIDPAALPGSTVGPAAADTLAARHLAEVIVHMRSWAAGARAAAGAVGTAEARAADRFGAPR